MVAAAENGVIGASPHGIPWTQTSDALRYRRYVADRPVIVGRVTWDLLGYVPSNILNVVLSQGSPAVKDPLVCWSKSISDALTLAAGWSEVVVIGGALTYRSFLEWADVIRLTRIHTNTPGNALFDLTESDWIPVRVVRHSRDSLNEHDFSYIDLVRGGSRDIDVPALD